MNTVAFCYIFTDHIFFEKKDALLFYLMHPVPTFPTTQFTLLYLPGLNMMVEILNKEQLAMVAAKPRNQTKEMWEE